MADAEQKSPEELLEDLQSPKVRQHFRLSRQAAGLTQMEVARRLKVSHSTLSLFENGLGDLHPADIIRLDKILNSEMDKIQRSYEQRIDYAYESAARPDGAAERKLLRQRADISQSELAKAAKISQSRISLWEAGQVELTADESDRWKLAIQLGMERAVAKSVIGEREIIKEEKEGIQKRLRELLPSLKEVHSNYKQELERAAKHLSNVREAYELEIKRLKKENAKLRLAVKMKNRKAK